MLLLDTHAHLDAEVFDEDRTEVVQRAHEAGIIRILAVGTDLESSQKAVELAQNHKMVYAAVGIHPHSADKFEAEASAVRALLDEKKVVAVGEIGLDFYRDFVSREDQMKAFHAQVTWARESDIPVSVHNRNADTEVMRTLAGPPVRGVLHCFSGSLEMAEYATSLGLFLSFAGNVTFPKSTGLHDAASLVPTDNILVESDAPVLSPQSRRGKRNESCFVVEIAQYLASLRRTPQDVFDSAVVANGDRLFGWGKS